MREYDYLADKAREDETTRENFLRQNEYYIIKCASKICHRYITKSDDEWSISLIAFSQAIDSYSLSKGNFYKFAKLVIKRRLIDYLKSQNKYRHELSVSPELFDTPSEDETEDLPIRVQITKEITSQTDDSTKLEIEALNTLFSQYGFSFLDLSTCSPHAAKTKKACSTAIKYMLINKEFIVELRETHQLPLKIIEKNTKVPRKILERHRKYIIAAIEILNGDYPNIAAYLNFIREDGD